MNQLIQVAGIIDVDEARMLIDLGVDYLGFPLRLPVNKEDLSEDQAKEVIKNINPPQKAVLITYLENAIEIINFCNKLGVNIVQLHGKIISKEDFYRTAESYSRLLRGIYLINHDINSLFVIHHIKYYIF